VQILFTSNTTGPTINSLANVKYEFNRFVINEDFGDSKWIVLGATVNSTKPYYYVD